MEKLMVVAIDFGTTYSGWAFSFYTDFKADPTKVFCKKWNNGQNISEKAPTAILVKPDGLTFEAFGYEAEDRFAELVDEAEHQPYYFFKNFKMLLYDNEKLTRADELKAYNGKRLPAKHVFSMVIRYLREDVLREYIKVLCTGPLNEDEIQWVLTVPAIWNIRSKQFMRECAVQAGIESSNLLIALEPEAAALYCKHISLQRQNESPEHKAVLTAFQPGARYMVVDAGGGTVDIVAHKICDDGSLEEIYAANGGDWGGSRIDRAYLRFLENIVGENVMTCFKEENMDDYIDMIREFDVKKRTINPTLKTTFKIKMPTSLLEIYNSYNNETLSVKLLNDYALCKNIKLRNGKMFIDCDLIKGLFDDTIKAIIDHIHVVLSDAALAETQSVIMVGGFSESAMLYEAFRAECLSRTVVRPQDAGLAVLKGAVLYGHCNRDITVRISPYNYGIAVIMPYDPEIHPIDRMIIKDGEMKVKNAFYKLIDKGDRLTQGYTSAIKYTGKSLKSYTRFALRLFASNNSFTKYTDEKGCYKLGELAIDCKDDKGEVCDIAIQLIVGGTEFEVKAVQQVSGKTIKATFTILD